MDPSYTFATSTNSDLKAYSPNEDEGRIQIDVDDDTINEMNESTTKRSTASIERMKRWRLILFSLFPLGFSTLFAFTHGVMFPSQVLKIVGNERKAYALGIVGAFSALSTGMLCRKCYCVLNNL
jgi:hypothetical protein